MTYARGVFRGSTRGTFFPAASRRPVHGAPLGTRIDTVGGVRVATHRVAIAGLERPTTILQVTDVHVRGVTPGLERIGAALEGMTADILVLTGDILAREWQATGAHRFLARLPDARLGRFAVMGNWEYWGGVDVPTWRRMLEPHRVTLLDNASTTVGGLNLVGVDDATAGRPDVNAALANLDPSLATIAITHSPIGFPMLARDEVRMVLCGHTHGGQVRLGPLGAAWVPRGTGEWVAGFYQLRDTWLYVSPGLGWSVAPLRFGCPPQVDRFDLIPEQAP